MSASGYSYNNLMRSFYSQDFSLYRNLRLTDDKDVNGNYTTLITKENNPELFIDDSIHFIKDNKFSENLINVPFDNFTVDWGDGIVEEYNSKIHSTSVTISGIMYKYDYGSIGNSLVKHTYSDNGRYIVKISGTVSNLKFQDATKVTKIIQWGNIGLRSISNMFNGLKHLESIANPTGLEHVVDASCAFSYSNVSEKILPYNFMRGFPFLVNCYEMFYNTNFVHIEDNFLSNNLSIKYIDYMFSNCKLETIGNSVFENDTSLLTAYCCFYNNYNTIKNIGENVFKNCKSLVYITGTTVSTGSPLFGYNAENLESAGNSMFEGCENLESVYNLFYYCKSLKTIGKDTFKGCKRLRNVSQAFYCCNSLTEIPEKIFYDIEYIENDNNGNHINFSACFYRDGVDCYFGKDMFNQDFFRKGGKINIGTQFTNYRTNYNSNTQTSNYDGTIYGYVPEFWNFPNYPECISNLTISKTSNGKTYYTTISGYYGYEMIDLSKYGGAISVQHMDNYNNVPEPFGTKVFMNYSEAESNIWLRPLAYDRAIISFIVQTPKVYYVDTKTYSKELTGYGADGLLKKEGALANYSNGSPIIESPGNYDYKIVKAYSFNFDKKWHTINIQHNDYILTGTYTIYSFALPNIIVLDMKWDAPSSFSFDSPYYRQELEDDLNLSTLTYTKIDYSETPGTNFYILDYYTSEELLNFYSKKNNTTFGSSGVSGTYASTLPSLSGQSNAILPNANLKAEKYYLNFQVTGVSPNMTFGYWYRRFVQIDITSQRIGYGTPNNHYIGSLSGAKINMNNGNQLITAGEIINDSLTELYFSNPNTYELEDGSLFLLYENKTHIKINTDPCYSSDSKYAETYDTEYIKYDNTLYPVEQYQILVEAYSTSNEGNADNNLEDYNIINGKYLDTLKNYYNPKSTDGQTIIDVENKDELYATDSVLQIGSNHYRRGIILKSEITTDEIKVNVRFDNFMWVTSDDSDYELYLTLVE